MGGIFGAFNNYSKPGPGVRKDAPRKKGVFLFMELLGRKFGAYVKLNLTYMITCIPAFAVVLHIIYSMLIEFAKPVQEEYAVLFLMAGIASAFLTLTFGLSPFSAGYYYILKNYSEEMHAWVFSDFFEKFRKNIKQSLLTFVIDLVALCVALLSLRLYFIMMLTGFGAMLTVPAVVLILVLVIYSLMTPYKWTMIVTIDLKLKHIYKNSLLLTLGEVKRTFFLLVASVVYFGVLGFALYSATIVGVILFLLIGYSAYGLIQQINLYPVIKKHLILTQGELE